MAPGDKSKLPSADTSKSSANDSGSRHSPRNLAPNIQKKPADRTPLGRKDRKPTETSPTKFLTSTPKQSPASETSSQDSSHFNVKPNKKACPCQTSNKDSWKINCTNCKQVWHTTCCNLLNKDFSEKMLNSFKTWLCPWCYTCPHPRPKTHMASKTEESLLSATVSSTISENVTSSLQELIEKKFTEALQDRSAPSHPEHQKPCVDLEHLERKIETLTQVVSDFIAKTPPDRPSPPPPTPPGMKGLISPAKIDCAKSKISQIHHLYVENVRENYITDEQCTELTDLLEKENPVDEGGRHVLKYGEQYKYHGSKAPTKPLPPLIQSIMENLNEEFCHEENKLNSCVVNIYKGQDSSISEHADDEMSINPDSHIHCISLGSKRTITFRDTTTGTEYKHDCLNASLYSMSRDSQNQYKHRIDKEPNSEEDSVRYSLTFRCTHWRYLNSTFADGDSNIGGKLRFGDGRGKIGASTPGRQEFSPKIEDLNPQRYQSYSNVVLMVGTNNLKVNEVSSHQDILNLYKLYKAKILEIQRLNNRCKIFVCPVLPSKLPHLNRKIRIFNSFLFGDLIQSTFGVTVVDGFEEFLASTNSWTLKENLSNPGDALHLNGYGLRVLVKLIKTSMFLGKQNRGRVNSSKLFSRAVAVQSHHQPR